MFKHFLATKGKAHLMRKRTASVVATERKVWLVSWRVLQTDCGTRHFVGYSVEDRMGRVSTPISTFDLRLRTGIATNGRAYKLLGPPGVDDEAMYVWRHYKCIWRFNEVTDVSDEYFVPVPERRLPSH